MSTTTIQNLLPAFASELEGLVRTAGRSELAEQIRELPILDRCRCGEGNCAHFYTAAKPIAEDRLRSPTIKPLQRTGRSAARR